jgi:ATP-dependent phosphoenolpyruvate carboxykinase
MQLIIEDSTMYKNDLIVMQLDFSSAYNTVDQPRLQCIMEALGFPADAVRMATALCSNTYTTIEFTAGTTAEIHITRGTEQGANHSPFLHNCFMEPLHRWLESGERGYKLTCVQKFQQQGHIAPRQHERVAAIAFADDNNLLTGSTSNMLTQCQKIER